MQEKLLKNARPANKNTVRVGGIVTREPVTFLDKKRSMRGRVVWIHPAGRFHVVEFGEGEHTVRECFMGVQG